jgi:hypothetical protein
MKHPTIQGMKYCPDCKTYKPYTDFGRVHTVGNEPRQGYCRTHDYARQQVSYRKNH